jgi:hypothetical protein
LRSFCFVSPSSFLSRMHGGRSSSNQHVIYIRTVLTPWRHVRLERGRRARGQTAHAGWRAWQSQPRGRAGAEHRKEDARPGGTLHARPSCAPGLWYA